jgi:hypothetical protein
MTEPVQWGRQPKRKTRPSADAAPGAPGQVVGPLETPPSPETAATIIHAPRPAAGAVPERESREEPRYRRETREPRDPDAGDAQLKDLVVLMARGLVDHPDDVSVEVLEPGEDASLELRVHPDDTGHVIGRQGRTARAMRLCLGAAAAKLGRRASLEIAD